jgi:hypothetical protein
MFLLTREGGEALILFLLYPSESHMSTESVKDIIIKAWVEKITKKMVEKGSSVAEFFADADFSLKEEPKRF